MKRRSLIIHAKDNVAVVLETCGKGDTILTDSGEITLLEDVEMGHKVLLSDLKANSKVFKYGEEIGYLKADTSKGAWVHVHNMDCDRGR